MYVREKKIKMQFILSLVRTADKHWVYSFKISPNEIKLNSKSLTTIIYDEYENTKKVRLKHLVKLHFDGYALFIL